MIIDSNILIYYTDTTQTKLHAYLNAHFNELFASDVTRLEVLGYSKIEPNDKVLLESFFQAIKIKSVSRNIIDKAIELRQQKKMSMGDSIIAATALIYNEPIFTHNEGDFKHIKGLVIIPLSSI